MARFAIFAGIPAVGSVHLTPEYVALNAKDMWQTYKHEFGRQYVGGEDQLRFQAFAANMKDAADLQQKNPLAQFGPTELSDKTKEEIRSYTTGYDVSSPCPGLTTSCCELPNEYSAVQLAAAPASIDWRNKGAVSSVKNQGSCGSCWAFATAGAVEGAWGAAGHTLKDVSVQEFVSCNEDDLGCQGGRVDTSLRWLARERDGNAVSWKQYPYASASGSAPACHDDSCWALSAAVSDDWCTVNCRAPTPNCPPSLCSCNGTNPHLDIAATVTKKGCQDLPKDEDQLAAQLAETGPFALAVNAGPWTSYKGGIMTGCPTGGVDHGVLAVGYGTDTVNGTSAKYWLIKNSWGTSFGESGYIRLAFGSNQCSLTYRPIRAIAEPASESLTV